MSRRGQITALALVLLTVGATILTASPALAITQRVMPPGVTLVNLGTLVAPDYRVSIDCAAFEPPSSHGPDVLNFAVLPLPLGTTARIDVENCETATPAVYFTDELRVVPTYTPLDGANADVPQRAGIEWSNYDTVPLADGGYEISANMYFYVNPVAELTDRFMILTPLAPSVADPAGDRQETITMQLDLDTSPRLTISPDLRFPNLPPGALMDGQPFRCNLISGDHPYDAREFVVTSPGRYTFRVADTTPPSGAVDFLRPFGGLMSDPVLALYSSFDSENPHDGVVGCNDDSRLDPFAGQYITSRGTLMSVLYPQFSVTLQPGTYTLAFYSYNEVSRLTPQSEPSSPLAGASSEVLADLKSRTRLTSALAPSDATVPETADVDVWFEPSTLALTGSNTASGGMLATGLALMTLGGLVLVSRRRLGRS